MFRFIFPCLVLLSSALFAKAQEDVVTKIRQSYNTYNQLIVGSNEEGLEYFPPHFEVKSTQNRPALGPVNISISYYYSEISDEEEPDWYRNEAIIRKVVYKESMPSYTDYQEFFYDENGKLIFYYSKLTGYSCGEKRLYFDNEKLIKIKFNPLTGEDCLSDEKFPEFTRLSGKLTKDDLDWEKWTIKKAGRHQNALINLFKSTQ